MSHCKNQVCTYQIPLGQKPQQEYERWFSPIQHLPWSILLHSAGILRSDSRFDIITADPIASITSYGDTCYITYKNKADKTVTGKPFQIARQLNSELFGDANSWPQLDDLPFIGGAMGCLTYDLGRSIETIPAIAQNDLQLPESAIGYYDWALIFDKQKQCLTLVQMGNEKLLKKRLTWLKSQTPSKVETFKLMSNWQSNLSKNDYLQRFAQVQEYLLSGDCYQINLAQRFRAKYQGDEWQAYNKLTNSNQMPFSAFMRLDKASILCVSPERFMQVSCCALTEHSEYYVQTKPIKGTRPRKQDPLTDQQQITDLKNATKDRAENLMIVDLLRNDISRVCEAGSVGVPKLFDIESYCAVHHMVSTIEGKLIPKKTAWDLLEATFPGGSITGAPKIRAIQIIEELEPHRRSVYCGSIFYIAANGLSDSNITIRTLIATNGELHCWGGGGLVADSIGDDEYQETLDKLAKILPVLSNDV